MPLFFALLLSLALHVTLIVTPSWLAVSLPSPRNPERLHLRLAPLQEIATDPDLAEEVSTQGSETPISLSSPQKTRGAPLQRAQQALVKHLLYPPQAIAQGLEGEVTLLLILDSKGSIISADIAKSSGHALLDQAALAAAGRMGSLPGNPRQTLLPVNFSLQ